MDAESRKRLGVRRAGSTLEDGESWRLACYVRRAPGDDVCPTVTQGGWPGMVAHLKAVHHPNTPEALLLGVAKQWATPRPNKPTGE